MALKVHDTEVGNPGYCKEGLYLSDLRCGSCSKVSVVDKKTEIAYGEKESFRPRPDAPIYFCLNISKKTVILG
jgi:hypothetical protein